MKPFICALVLCLGSISLHAQATAAEEAAAGVKALLQRMFSMGINEEELQELAKEANKVGVPRQQIIEAIEKSLRDNIADIQQLIVQGGGGHYTIQIVAPAFEVLER